jgi:hypothetical protein
LSLISNHFDEIHLEDFQSHFAGHRTKTRRCDQERKDNPYRDVRLASLNHLQPCPLGIKFEPPDTTSLAASKGESSLCGWLSAFPAKAVSEMDDH